MRRLDRRLPLLTGGPRDLPARQQTLRDTIAWSYDLLQRRRTDAVSAPGVFVGGCTLEAAEAIDGANEAASKEPGASISVAGDRPSHLDLVASLVDSSLLRRQDGPGGEPRYSMLDTIREFGLEQLALAGEDVSVRRNHLA